MCRTHNKGFNGQWHVATTCLQIIQIKAQSFMTILLKRNLSTTKHDEVQIEIQNTKNTFHSLPFPLQAYCSLQSVVNRDQASRRISRIYQSSKYQICICLAQWQQLNSVFQLGLANGLFKHPDHPVNFNPHFGIVKCIHISSIM